MTQVATFNLPWRIAFLPDGRMLITEKVGPIWLVTQTGRKDRRSPMSRRSIIRARTACWASSSRPIMRPITMSISPMPSRAIMAVEPGAGARPSWRSTRDTASLDGLQVMWRQMPTGKGGQFGAAGRLFARWQIPVPDGRRPPAHDAGPGPQPAGGQDPAPDPGRQARARQSDGRQDRRGDHSPDRSARRHRSRQDRAGGQHLYLPRPEPDAVRNLDQRPPHALWPGLRARWPVVGSWSMAPRAATS